MRIPHQDDYSFCCYPHLLVRITCTFPGEHYQIGNNPSGQRLKYTREDALQRLNRQVPCIKGPKFFQGPRGYWHNNNSRLRKVSLIPVRLIIQTGSSEESASSTTTAFPLISTLGFFFIGGETMNLSFMLSRTTYSLNKISILFPLKFFAPLAGTLFTTTGGVRSLGPPEGALILAQAAIAVMSDEQTRSRTIILLFINSRTCF
jgi:hypothetical protein